MSEYVHSPFLLEDHGIRYSIASEEFGKPIIEILSESFAREPMCAALGILARDLAPLIASFIPECMTNGLSVVALPLNHPETLAGAFICRDFKSPLPNSLLIDFPWFRPIAEALINVDVAYEAKRPGLALGEVLDLWMVGVPQSTHFERKGLASTLFRLCAAVGRSRGFKRCVTKCTGYYSQTAARKTGFKECERLAYRDFRFEGRAVFSGINPPHSDIILFEREESCTIDFKA
jgi:hypothetical protein